MNRTRINLTIAPATDEALQRLAAETGHSKSVVMDLAIAAYIKQGPQFYIQDCTPMTADIVSGHYPEPIELPDGGGADWHVKNRDGVDVPWTSVAPAWRKLDLGNVADVCIVARRDRDVAMGCEHIRAITEELRQFLGECGAAVCARGRILVFNADGTRVAVSERDLT